MKILELRNEIGVYNKTLNKFFKSYKISEGNFGDGDEVSLDFYNYIISLKDKIKDNDFIVSHKGYGYIIDLPL